MGVDFYSCHKCNDVFSDCGDWGICKCGNKFCGDCYDAMRESYPNGNNNYDLVECDYCNETIIEDDTLLRFALELLNIDRMTLEAKYREKNLL